MNQDKQLNSKGQFGTRFGFLMSAVACLFELVDALKDGKKQGSEE